MQVCLPPTGHRAVQCIVVLVVLSSLGSVSLCTDLH
uniref:Uncharacterized protein n=1 Tax=Anguilla anguilla TaxID=7936 RepID=A0A0E9QVB8_ANGAN